MVCTAIPLARSGHLIVNKKERVKVTEQEKKETRDTGGLTANNNHAGGVEDLRNHVVVKSQRPKRQSAQSENRFVGKYLDRKASASTANRRSRSGADSRSGVGGARRGVREYSAVNYHKVELTSRETRPDRTIRGDKQCCSCLDDPEQTNSGNTPSTRTARGRGECVVLRPPSPRAARGRACGGAVKSVQRRSDAVERTQLQLN